jgi:hypothetical protein
METNMFCKKVSLYPTHAYNHTLCTLCAHCKIYDHNTDTYTSVPLYIVIGRERKNKIHTTLCTDSEYFLFIFITFFTTIITVTDTRVIKHYGGNK